MHMSIAIRKVRKTSVICLLFSESLFFLSPSVQGQNTSLIIQSGTTLTVAGNNIVLNNTDLTCNGTFNASNATVSLTGSNSTTFNGTGTPLIDIMNLNTGAAAVLTLNAGLQVSDALNFQNGVINLNGQELQLTGSALLQSESENSHITGITGGQVVASALAVSNPNQLNIGSLGAALTSAANLGNVTVSRIHVPATGFGGAHGIQRTYLIQPANDASLNATLRFYYLNEELNGDDPTTLALWQSADGITWTQVGADSRDAINKYVQKGGISSLSYWTLTDASDALPLTLVSFRVTCQDQDALVQWQTAMEADMNEFIIQRSTDGTTWTNIGEVAATNSLNGASYLFKDANPPAEAFYRLQIVEQSGSSSYSPVFQGSCSQVTLPFMVYPNPAVSSSLAQLSVRQASTTTIQLISMKGQLLYEGIWNLQPGLNQYVLPVTRLAAGTYIVRLQLNGNTVETKLNKQ